MTKLQKIVLNFEGADGDIDVLRDYARNCPGYICTAPNVNAWLYYDEETGVLSKLPADTEGIDISDAQVFSISSNGYINGEPDERSSLIKLDTSLHGSAYGDDRAIGDRELILGYDKNEISASQASRTYSQNKETGKGELRINKAATKITQVTEDEANITSGIASNGSNTEIVVSSRSDEVNNMTPIANRNAENIASIKMFTEPIDFFHGQHDHDQTYVVIDSRTEKTDGSNKTYDFASLVVNHHDGVKQEISSFKNNKREYINCEFVNDIDNPLVVKKGSTNTPETVRYVAFTDQLPFAETDNFGVEVDDNEDWNYRTFAMKMDCSDNEGEGTTKRVGSIEMNPQDLSVSTTSNNSDDLFAESATAQVYLTKGDISDTGSISNDAAVTVSANSFSTNKETGVTVSNVCRADFNASPAAAYEGVSGESNAILSAVNRKSIPNSTLKTSQEKGAQIYLSDVHGIDSVFKADYNTGVTPVNLQKVGVALNSINKGNTVDWNALNNSVGTQLSESGFLIYAPSVKVVDPTDETHAVKHVAFTDQLDELNAKNEALESRIAALEALLRNAGILTD